MRSGFFAHFSICRRFHRRLPPGRPGWRAAYASAIVFTRDDPVTGYDIFVVQPDGSGLYNLTALFAGSAADGARDVWADW